MTIAENLDQMIDQASGDVVGDEQEIGATTALLRRAEEPHARKVWLRWNPEDCTRVLDDGLFKKPVEGRTRY